MKCHFCKYPNIVLERDGVYFFAKCTTCGGSSPAMTTEEKALKRWNGKLKELS